MKLLTLTDPTDAVEDVAGLTLTAVGAQQVDTTMTLADLLSALTLIDICRGERNREHNHMYLLCFVLQEKGCCYFSAVPTQRVPSSLRWYPRPQLTEFLWQM